MRSLQFLAAFLATSFSALAYSNSPGNRYPREGEVKASVVSGTGDTLTVRVSDSKSSLVQSGSKIKVRLRASNWTTLQTVFFFPASIENGTIIPKDGLYINRGDIYNMSYSFPQIQPVFANHCNACHVVDYTANDVILHHAEIYRRVSGDTSSAIMPPGGMSDDDRNAILRFVRPHTDPLEWASDI